MLILLLNKEYFSSFDIISTLINEQTYPVGQLTPVSTKLDLGSPGLEWLPLQVFKHGWDPAGISETVRSVPCSSSLNHLKFPYLSLIVWIPYWRAILQVRSDQTVICFALYSALQDLSENLAWCLLSWISCRCASSRIELTAGLHRDTLLQSFEIWKFSFPMYLDHGFNHKRSQHGLFLLYKNKDFIFK